MITGSIERQNPAGFSDRRVGSSFAVTKQLYPIVLGTMIFRKILA
jgi:hypothetical protein